MSTATNKQSIVVTRVIEAPVEQVWRAWAEPELVKRWWGPDGFTAPVAEMDFRVGGTSLVSMVSPQTPEHFSTWHYRAIVPHELIAYVHNLSDPQGNKIDPAAAGLPPDFPQDVLNEVVLKDLGDGRTELTVSEFGWTPGQLMELSRLGLEQCLGKLAGIFAAAA